MENVQRLLEEVIKGFVSNPNDVLIHVSEDTDERGKVVMVNVKVHKSDVGICIGEQGKTAEAIRRIIGLVGFKQTGERVYVKIDAPKIPRNHFEYQA